MVKFRRAIVGCLMLFAFGPQASGASVKTCRDDEQFSWNQGRVNTVRENLLFELFSCFDGSSAQESKQNDKVACNWFVGKAVKEIWKHSDFYDAQLQRYLTTREIDDAFFANNAWRKIGTGDSQDALTEAEAKAHSGHPVIAFKRGHIALILAGGLVGSGSWNLDVPRAAQFNIAAPDAAFVGCKLSWGWKPEDKAGVGIYVKCGQASC